MDNQNQERYYDLDALRSVLMSLGIVLHSACVFSPNNWAIQNAITSDFYQGIIDFIHLFRMPAFFIVSGFFVHFSYINKGSRIFIKQRIPRIIVPLFVTAISLNSIQYWLIHKSNDFLSIDYIISGGWVSHLWFLNCLVYYFSISYIIMEFLPKLFDNISRIATNVYNKYGIFLLVALPFISLPLIKISYLYPESLQIYYDLSIPTSIQYSIFFIFGIFIGSCHKARVDFLSVKATAVLMMLSCLTYGLKLSVTNTITLALFEMSATWFLCALIFHLFNLFLNRKIPFFLYLSNASYSIYLFHHIFVIFLGIYLIPLNIPVFIKFILLITSTFIITNLIHYFLISRFNILSYLFNGKQAIYKGSKLQATV